MTDPSRFKISFLTGDIATGKLAPSQPLPKLTKEQHTQLRLHLQQESIWNQEFGGRAGGKKDRVFTERIRESWEREGRVDGDGDGLKMKESEKGKGKVSGGGSLEGKGGKGVNVGFEEQKMLREFERMVKAIASAGLMEFWVELALAVRDVEERRSADAVTVGDGRACERQGDELSIATLDAFMSALFVEVGKGDGSESSATLASFDREKVEKVSDFVEREMVAKTETAFDFERWMQVFAFLVCFLQFLGFVIKISGWLAEDVLVSKEVDAKHQAGDWF